MQREEDAPPFLFFSFFPHFLGTLRGRLVLNKGLALFCSFNALAVMERDVEVFCALFSTVHLRDWD